MKRGVQLDMFHATLWQDVQSGDPKRFNDAFMAALNSRCETECEQCGAVFCPHHHPLHFQEACPACLLGPAEGYPAPVAPQ